MGLYDDEPLQETDAFRQAGAAHQALTEAWKDTAPTTAVGLLATAVDAVAAAVQAYAAAAADTTWRHWRASCVGIARELRALTATDDALAAAFVAFAAERPAFEALLDLPDGFTPLELVQHGRFGCTLAHPQDWVVEPAGDARVTLRPDATGNEQFTASLQALGAAMAMEPFAARCVEELRAELPGCNITDRRFRPVGAVDGYEVVFAFTRDETAFRGRQVFAMHGNTGYRFTHVAPADAYDAGAATVDRILDSIALRP